MLDLSYGRSLAAVRKDAFVVGVSRADSAAEYDFIAEITAKMKIQRLRVVAFDNANDGEKLLLGKKIDAIISKINYSPHLESKFLLSKPYAKTEISLAVLANNTSIWTLNDLNGKSIAFVPKEISSEQIRAIWPNAKLIATRTLNEALNTMQNNEAEATIANRQSLEQAGSSFRIFPNKLAENNIVALFAPGSKNLQEEFNKAIVGVTLRGYPENQSAEKKDKTEKSEKPENPEKKRIDKILMLLEELKKELEILQKELK